MTAPLPPAPCASDPRERRALRWALLVWALNLAVLLALTLGQGPERQSVMRHYRTASASWLAGEPLYGEGREHGFLYLPAFAVLHAPFALLPFAGGVALWRLSSLALLAWGLWRLSRAFAAERPATFFLVATLLALGWSAARHGQSTLPMAGAILAAAGALAERRLTHAALWCALAVALKPIALVPALLAAACWRGVAPRMALALLAVGLLPFLAQSPAYVAAQWQGFARMIASADVPLDRARFLDVPGALASLGLDLPRGAALALRLLGALAALGALAYARRRVAAPVAALLFYVVACVYLLAFNPRTEHNTYALLAPALGLFCAWAVLEGRRRAAALYVVLSAWLWLDHALTFALTGSAQVWTKPLGLLVCATAFAWDAKRTLGGPPGPDRGRRQEIRPL